MASQPDPLTDPSGTEPELKPRLDGEHVILRPPEPRDVEARLRQGRNAEYHRMVGGENSQDGPIELTNAQDWSDRIAAAPYSWVIELKGTNKRLGEAIGHARLHDLDPANRRARYSIGIFNPDCWGHGYGTEATLLVLGYAFETLRLHRVELRVLAFNERAIRSYAKCGFVQEGIEREGAWLNGRWESDVWMSILEDEYFAHSGTVRP